MGRSIGIYFGDKYCSVGYCSHNRVKIVQNQEAEDYTPSVVGYFKDQIIIGAPASDRMTSAPEDTIISIRRLMGRAYPDPEVRRVKEKYQYEIIPPSDGIEEDVRVLLGGKEYSPIQIASMILKKLKEDAEMRLDDKVEFAVITVPAYFNERQRDATRKAGQLAGLKVLKILDEPFAAAIAFGEDNVGAEESKTILVYDFRGGTFDVSVITIAGGVFAQLDIEGTMWLGGDDFDNKIMDYFLEHVKKEYGLDAKENKRFMMELKNQAEKAKKALTTMKRTDIVIHGLLQDKEGNLLDVEVGLSREQFEKMIERDIKKSIELVQEAIKNTGLKPGQIDHVLLVGGSSTIPLVRRSLIDVFGEKKVLMNIDPIQCVSFGAARIAVNLEGIECSKGHVNPPDTDKCTHPGCSESLVGDITPWQITPCHYGIQTEGDKFEVIIEKGSPYPTPEPIVKEFCTPQANMRRIKVPVYADFDENTSKKDLLVTIWLQLPENVPKGTPVDVAFMLDDEGILENVKVRLKDGSGRQVDVYPDRFVGKRSPVEKKADEIWSKWEAKKAGADADMKEKVERLFAKALIGLNENYIDEAEKNIEQIEKELGKIEEHPPPPNANECTTPECNDLLGIIFRGCIVQPFGMQTGDDKFVVIFKKETRYPTAEPEIIEIHPPFPKSRRIKLPIYAGFDEVASKNELQILVRINIPKDFPSSSPIEVAFGLDDAGILEVEASIEGKKIWIYSDRLNEKRSKVEKYVDEIWKSWKEIAAEVNQDIKERIEKYYNEAIDALSKNEIDEAEIKIQQIEGELG